MTTLDILRAETPSQARCAVKLYLLQKQTERLQSLIKREEKCLIRTQPLFSQI